MPTIKWPFGPAEIQSPAVHAAAPTITITNGKTFLTLPTMTSAVALNLNIDADLEAGAELILRAKSDATARDITPGVGMTGPVLSGVIGKTKVVRYVYDGSTFVASNVGVQID